MTISTKLWQIMSVQMVDNLTETVTNQVHGFELNGQQSIQTTCYGATYALLRVS